MPTAESQALKNKIQELVSLLKEAHETVKVAISVELEYADYAAVERLKLLRSRIENEVNNNKNFY